MPFQAICAVRPRENVSSLRRSLTIAARTRSIGKKRASIAVESSIASGKIFFSSATESSAPCQQSCPASSLNSAIVIDRISQLKSRMNSQSPTAYRRYGRLRSRLQFGGSLLRECQRALARASSVADQPLIAVALELETLGQRTIEAFQRHSLDAGCTASGALLQISVAMLSHLLINWFIGTT